MTNLLGGCAGIVTIKLTPKKWKIGGTFVMLDTPYFVTVFSFSML
jgi:hypothetical protein